MKIRILLSAFALFLMSCSGDDNIQSVSSDETIDYYVITRTFTDAVNQEIRNLVTYDVAEGKFGSYTIENFVNNVSQGIESYTDYIYQDGQLMQVPAYQGTKHFYYDADGNLIGASLEYIETNSSLNYRFIHNENGTVFCERLNLSYTDPEAEMSYRNILTFDANDNLISAGADINLDGQPDYLNTYTFSGNDLTGVNLASGGSFSYSYTNVVDNYNFIAQHSFGKQVLFLLCSEIYCSDSIESIEPILNSEHIRQDLWDDAVYVTTPFNFVKKKSETITAGVPTPLFVETEYFFN